jgi:serine phosphatase RsbU (regulator of sigma subunit)
VEIAMPPPASTRVGQLHVEVRYFPSANGPGGDIHDVLATPFGVRLLIGDVMGTGTTANQAGASVLGAWRELARSEPSLAGVAVRLHSLIAQSEHPEHFVTALLVNFPASVAAEDRTGYAAEHVTGSIGDSWAELVCCGHPPPLRVRDGTATYISSLPASPPLGLLDLAEGWCTATAIPFRADDRLLLYTDGVSEARDSLGRFFPLTDRAAAAMANPDDDAARADGRHPLDQLMASLRNHIGDRAAGTDDILMVLVERG